MRKTKRQHRWLSLALSLCMLASVFPLSGMTYAAETGCNHVHDDACGYVEAREGQPCTFTHEHDDACGWAEAKEAAPCSAEAAHTVHDETCGGDPDTGEGCTFAHEHDGACGWAEAKEAVPCSVEAAHTAHETAVCGYVEADTGAPCTHSHDESCGGIQAKAGGQDIAAAALPGASQRGAGYVWDNTKNKLTITTNEGTTAWREALKPSGVNFLEFGDQVTAIGDNAFLGCSNLDSITLPEGVKSIGDSAFREAHSRKVVIPASVEHIGEGAFASEKIETIQVEPENQHFVIVDNALYSKNMDTLYAWPKNKAGTAITIPGSVERIGSWTFYRYTNLKSVTFPAGLKSIGDHAFLLCASLQSGDLSGFAGLTSIGDEAFKDCNLTSVKFPAGLQSIGEQAFWNGRFQSVKIPASVEHIGEGAFSSIVLESIHLDSGNRHFINEDGVLYNAAMDTLYCYLATKTGDAFTIPDSVERIGEGAFRSCKSLTSVALPSGVKSIGDGAFAGSGLQSVDLSGCAGLTSIEDSVFSSCRSLTSVALPAGLKSIGEFAFSGSDDLQSADLSGCASLESIGYRAFSNCQSLTSVTFPAGLKSIGDQAFDGCIKITTIRFMGDVPPNIDNFGEVTALKQIYYPAGAKGYTDGPFRGKTFIEIYRLTVKRGVDETGGSPYDPGDRVTITADTGPGKTFVRWRGGSNSVFAEGSREDISTTIIMPANHLTLTVTYAEDEIEHSYGDWQHDDTYHWHECPYGDIADMDVHDFGRWVTDKKPTETKSGSRRRECNTCGYRQTEDLAPTGQDFEYRTLTDEASGVKVIGYFTGRAALEVREKLLHRQGGCNVCDDIRQRQKNGELIALFDIALKSGQYRGELDVEIPVGEQYNGQTVIMLHCKDNVLESRAVTVSGVVARGTFSGLSPYAVAKVPGKEVPGKEVPGKEVPGKEVPGKTVPGKTVITGLPESYTLLAGQTVGWTPDPAGGQWSYDKDLLEMTQSGDTYTFKALKEGKTMAAYMVDGVPHTVTITVNSSIIPQTGDTMNMLPWTLLMLAALLGGGLLVYRRRGYKKRHG